MERLDRRRSLRGQGWNRSCGPVVALEITIGLGFTDTPADGDHVTEQDGLRVFVAPELAAPLEDAAIDVTAEDDGAARLVFRPQGELQN